MGSIIMSGAYIGKNSIIAAGTMIPQGKIIMDNSLVIGNPGQVMRNVTNSEIKLLRIMPWITFNFQKNLTGRIVLRCKV